MARLESCPTCGNKTSENATECPACGEPLSPGWAEDIKRGTWKTNILIWGSILAVLIVWINWNGTNDDSYLRNLKETNPAEYQERIQKLEAQVAKVPASDFDENIRLYTELQKLNPDSARYADKIAHYQRKQKEAEAEEKAAEVAAKYAAEAEKKRKGFHCLSGWDGSHREVKKYTEKRMRDPDSFEHIETRIMPVNANGEHTLIMKYRANNAFGGKTVGVTTATIRNVDCHATILSLE